MLGKEGGNPVSGLPFFITEHPDSLQKLLENIPEFAKLLGDEDGPIPLYEQEVEFLEKYINPEHVLEMSVGETSGKVYFYHVYKACNLQINGQQETETHI